MGLEKRRKFHSGQKLSAEWVNEIAKEVERLGKLSGTGGITIGNSPTGITIRGDGSGEWRLAKAKVDPESGGTYPTFSSWADQSTITTVYPFVLCNPTYTDTNATGDITTNDTTAYIKAFSITRHYIPSGTIMLLNEIAGKWYANYILPTLYGTLSADLTQSTGHADCSLESITYCGATISGTVRVYDQLLNSSKKLASGNKVVIEAKGTKLMAIESNNCAVAAS